MSAENAIGAQLRRARKARGMTLRDVVDSSEDGLSRAGLAAIERGERYPNLRTLELLAVALDIQIHIEPGATTVMLR